MSSTGIIKSLNPAQSLRAWIKCKQVICQMQNCSQVQFPVALLPSVTHEHSLYCHFFICCHSSSLSPLSKNCVPVDLNFLRCPPQPQECFRHVSIILTSGSYPHFYQNYGLLNFHQNDPLSSACIF